MLSTLLHTAEGNRSSSGASADNAIAAGSAMEWSVRGLISGAIGIGSAILIQCKSKRNKRADGTSPATASQALASSTATGSSDDSDSDAEAHASVQSDSPEVAGVSTLRGQTHAAQLCGPAELSQATRRRAKCSARPRRFGSTRSRSARRGQTDGASGALT